MSGTFGHYQDAFLYSLALWFGIDVDTLDLSERAAEAAFALAQVYQGDVHPQSNAKVPPPEEEKAAEVDNEYTMEWDEPEEQLAPELLYLFTAVAKGERKLELREVLQNFPKFADLLGKPPENNHRGDRAGFLDKERKAQQQALLHGLRMTAAVYMGINTGLDPAMIHVWLKQVFQHWCEQYHKLLQLRKESSIPGSVAPQDAAGVLFKKDDLQQAKLVQSVNFASGGKRFKGFHGKRTFPTNQWGKSFNTPKGGRFRS